MALEVTAAIVGLVAAAGKVVELLGPAVSSFNTAPKHIQNLQTETKNTEIILTGFKRLIAHIDQSPLPRKNFIKVGQLIAVLDDGVLLFSDLEALAQKFSTQVTTVAIRLQWFRKESEFESLLRRLLTFKTTAQTMLNILQCESDEEARNERRLLISMTKDFSEMSRRLARLESCLQTSNVSIRRPLTVHSSTSSAIRSGIPWLSSTKSRGSWSQASNSFGFQFDADLKASRVYRKATRDTTDFSFRSSAVLSHAWTMLSDATLSDISDISVVCLPVTQDEIINSHHYGSWGHIRETNEVLTMESSSSGLDNNSVAHVLSSPTLRDAGISGADTKSNQGQSPKAITGRDKQLHIATINHFDVEISNVVSEFDWPRYSFYNNSECLTVDGVIEYLAINTITDFLGANYPGIMDTYYPFGEAFVLVYSISSRASFERMNSYARMICQIKDSDMFPIAIVGSGNNDSSREVTTLEGQSRAEETGCLFYERIGEYNDDQQEIFRDLVRARRVFIDAKQRDEQKDVIMEMVQSDREKIEAVQTAFSGRVSRLLKRSPLRSKRRVDTMLSAIDES